MDEDLGCGMCSSHISRRKGIVTLFLTQFVTSSYIYILGIGPNTHLAVFYHFCFHVTCSLQDSISLLQEENSFETRLPSFDVLMTTLNCCVWTLLCSPELLIVVNSHVIQIRRDLCARLQTALYMLRMCLPPNVNVVLKIHLHLKL